MPGPGYLQMLVQAVRVPVLEVRVALVRHGGAGLLHPWKRESPAFRQGAGESSADPGEHPLSTGPVRDCDDAGTSPSRKRGNAA